MADQINLSFPDQSYSSSNKPSVSTLKNDLTTVEEEYNQAATEINEHETRLDTAESDIDTLQTQTGDGWVAAGETWTYSSVDDPTGVFTISGDKTTKYSAGMRIRFVNNSATIYGIITAVSYSAPNTTVKFCHEIDPTDSLALTLMANSAITVPYYSVHKVPFGFPADVRKWTVYKTDTTNRQQSGPSTGTWYNVGTTNSQLVIPIGAWDVSYQVCARTNRTSTTQQDIQVTLSTANNSSSDSEFNAFIQTSAGGNGANSIFLGGTLSRRKFLNLSSKTTYYLNARAPVANSDSLDFLNSDFGAMTIRAVLAYL